MDHDTFGMEEKGSTTPDSSSGANGYTDGSARKKIKISRAKIACLPCRSRRTKCGGSPPNPCEHCLESRLKCDWPPVESRPKRGRPPKKLSLADGGLSFLSDSGTPRTRTDSLVSPMLEFSDAQRQLGSISGQQPHISHQPQHHQTHAASTSTYESIDQLFGNYTNPPTSVTISPAQATLGRVPMVDTRAHRRSPSKSVLGWELGTLAQPDPDRAEVIPEEFLIPDQPREEGSGRVVRHKRKGGFTALDDGLAMEVLDNGESSEDIRSKFVTHPVDTRGLPPPTIITDILDTFFLHFGCHFPFLNRRKLQASLDIGGPQAVFLFNAVGAVAARLSSHPEIGPLHLPPHLYGQVFYDRAMAALGSQGGVPSRETVTALLLLSLAAFGAGKDMDMRMWRRMAVELAVEMGLHKAPTEGEVTASAEDLRADRLVFWSVLILDYTLAFGDGRQTSIDPSEVTVTLPTEDDIHPAPTNGEEMEEGESQHLRSPFGYVAETIFALGTLSNILNAEPIEGKFAEPQFMEQLRTLWTKIAIFYDELPLDMIWSGQNLQWHFRAGSGPTYLFLHLWNFTIQALRYLVDKFRSTFEEYKPSGRPHDQTPQKWIVAENWLHTARFISEMLVLSDIVDPVIYLANPLVTHCFYIAQTCFLRDMESYRNIHLSPDSSTNNETNPSPESDTVEKSHSGLNQAQKLFAAISMQNIMSLKQGISRQTLYWKGLVSLQNKFDDRFSKAQVSNETFAKLAKVVNGPRTLPSRLGEGMMGNRKREKRHRGLTPLSGPTFGSLNMGTMASMESPSRGLPQMFGGGTDLPFGLNGSTGLTPGSSSSPTNFSGYPAYLSSMMDSPNYGALGMPDVQQFLQQLGVTST